LIETLFVTEFAKTFHFTEWIVFPLHDRSYMVLNTKREQDADPNWRLAKGILAGIRRMTKNIKFRKNFNLAGRRRKKGFEAKE